MKKLLGKTLAGVLGMLAACSLGACSEEQTVLLPQESHLETSALRTKDEALAIAESLNAARSAQSRAEGKRLKEVSVVGRANSRTASDTLIYAVNYEDNAGFVLVSAARHGIAVIGYADEGNFDAESASDNSNFSYYLDAAKDYVEAQEAYALSPNGHVVRPDDVITLVRNIIPVVNVKWGQRYPEGMYCDNYYSGCVQTAMAQMMSYLKAPTSITLTYPERDIAIQNLNWTELLKHKQSCGNSSMSIENHLTECEASVEVHKALGRLCRELGHRNGATYYPDVTTAGIELPLSNFKKLCPEKTFSEIKSFDLKYSNLWDDLSKKNGVALVAGYSTPSIGIGHAWICDGGECTETQGPGYNGTVVTTSSIYYHFNWGAYGVNDGYFAAGVFDQSKPKSRADYKYDTRYFVVYK